MNNINIDQLLITLEDEGVKIEAPVTFSNGKFERRQFNPVDVTAVIRRLRDKASFIEKATIL